VLFTTISTAETIFELKHFRTNTHVVVAVAVESSLEVTTTLKFLLRTQWSSKESKVESKLLKKTPPWVCVVCVSIKNISTVYVVYVSFQNISTLCTLDCDPCACSKNWISTNLNSKNLLLLLRAKKLLPKTFIQICLPI